MDTHNLTTPAPPVSLYQRVRAAAATRFGRTGNRTASLDDLLYEMGMSPMMRLKLYGSVAVEMAAMADYGDGTLGTDMGGNATITFTGTIVKSEDRIGMVVYLGRAVTQMPTGALADLSIEWVND